MNSGEVFEIFKKCIAKFPYGSEYLWNRLWFDDSFPEEGFYFLRRIDGIRGFSLGASKIVIFLKDVEEWCIKIPLRGVGTFLSEDEKFDECYEFERANIDLDDDKLKCWDYCQRESYVYNMIPKTLRPMLTKTEFVGYIGEMPVYVSEKAICQFYSHSAHPSMEAEEKERGYKNNDRNVNAYICTNAIARFIDDWGEELALQFFHFMHENNLDNDLHSGNFMFDSNNKIRCIDYSDYKENDL